MAVYWQMGGLGPMAGQNHHFAQYAPEPLHYAIERYVKETSRLYGVLNKQLADGRAFIAGDYSIADMACYPWIVPHERQRQTLLERVAQPIGEPGLFADQPPALLYQVQQGTHRRALRLQRRESVAVMCLQVKCMLGVGQIVFGVARLERFAVFGQGRRLDEKEQSVLDDRLLVANQRSRARCRRQPASTACIVLLAPVVEPGPEPDPALLSN